MDKVVLVDDEDWILENLKVSIDWKQYGFTVVGTATNGLDAFSLIRETEPALVFTDIRMAGMNGLELIRRVNELTPSVKFVLLSGFAEFAYAQKAISSGALAYLLKPIDENEVIQILLRFQQEKRGRDIDAHFYEALLLAGDSNPAARALLVEKFKGLGFDPVNAVGLRVIVSLGATRLEFPQVARKLVFELEKDRTAYLIADAGTTPPERWIGGVLPAGIAGVGIGGILHDVGLILDAIDEATIAAFHTFNDPSTKVHLYQTVSGDFTTVDSFFETVSRVLKKDTIFELVAAFRSAAESFRTGAMNIVHAFYLYNMVFFYWQGRVEINPLSQVANLSRLVARYGTIEGLLEALLDSISQTKLSPALTNGLKNETASAIIKYLNVHFAENVSLTDLSEHFKINSGYISQLLKKEIGKNYLEYLTALRMENACLLLRTTELNINQIAERSGYEDNLYFRKIFKKFLGKTPSEYRLTAEKAYSNLPP